MLIPTHIEVFEDPEYCVDRDIGYCPELYRIDGRYYCHRFKKHGKDALKFVIEKDGPHCLETPKKCDACKEAYQSELIKREPPLVPLMKDQKPMKNGQECEFDCEDRGIKLMENKSIGDCEKCPNIPPF